MDLPAGPSQEENSDLHQQFQMVPLVLEVLHHMEKGDAVKTNQMVGVVVFVVVVLCVYDFVVEELSVWVVCLVMSRAHTLEKVKHLKTRLDACKKTVDEVLCDDTTIARQQENLDEVERKLDVPKVCFYLFCFKNVMGSCSYLLPCTLENKLNRIPRC